MTVVKKPPSIDTLRYAQQLERAGLDRGAANAMAQALNEELEDRLLTKADIAEALEPNNAKLADLAQAFDPIHLKLAEIDQRFDAVDLKLAEIDRRFDAVDAKFEAMDAKFDAVDAKFEAMDAKFEAKIEALDTKIDVKHDALNDKIDSLSNKMLFGFSMVFLVLSALVALGVFQFIRSAPPGSQAAVAVEQPAEPPATETTAAALPRRGDLRTPEATWRGERGLR